jgi:hypothetical protein
MTVANGFGNKTEGAGAGNQVAVVTNGVDVRVHIRHVRLSLRLAGTGRCHAVPVVRLRSARLHLLHRQLTFRRRRHRLQESVGAVRTECPT